MVTGTGDLVGGVVGSGPPLLLLHGGPGMSDYLGPLVEDIGPGWTVATYTQRGLAPSSTDGPVDVAAHVADVLAVVDHLGWERPVLGGHSWGGHLTLHVLADHAARFSGALVIDPLGGVGDGGTAEFAGNIEARTPDANRPRLAELAALEERAPLPLDLALEQLRLIWPAYFPDPDPDAAPPMPDFGLATRTDEMYASVVAELPALEVRLSGCPVPTTFLHGQLSPMAVSASTDTAAVMGEAVVEVVPGAGHFIWSDAPGAVRRALDALSVRLS